MDSAAGSEAGKTALRRTGGEGGGGGGGVRALPAGVLEITDEATRFVPFTDAGRLALAFTVGAVLGALILTRRQT
jgi:uncharacterized spore protein YtfJ